MIIIKNPKELEKMRQACKIAFGALECAGKIICDGMTTFELDREINKYILKCGAKPSFLNYNGFPASSCISINEEVIHGIPSKQRTIKNGDIVSVDVGAYYNGFHGDNAKTFAVGEITEQAKKLIDITEQSFFEGIKFATIGNRIGDISNAIERYVRENSMGIVKKFVGHGIGRNLHESPEIPNFGPAGKGERLMPGMTLAIEPMINLVGDDVYVLPDKWTVKTTSKSLSAHFEHTILITKGEPEILTTL